jgi:hypothetical protein
VKKSLYKEEYIRPQLNCVFTEAGIRAAFDQELGLKAFDEPKNLRFAFLSLIGTFFWHPRSASYT